jgi:rhodanese-related sulfurtransferase
MSIATAAHSSPLPLGTEGFFDPELILEKAREQARESRINYAGDLSPEDAWQLFSNEAATLIDVRTIEERASVGYVPDSIHVAWAVGAAMERNPRFVRELESKAGKLDVILFLCRSGKRSVAAAEAVSRLGFKNVFNVIEGFEGEQEILQRGGVSGWRNRDLPWTKD